jgi:SNF2 family DNA or RNA helicase
MLSPKDLRPYQWRSIRWVVNNPRCALFLDMGLGKTVSVLSAVKAMKKRQMLTKPVLVVAPLRVVHTVWRQEAQKWAHTQDITFSTVHGNAKARRAALGTQADVYLINPEGLRWLLDQIKELEGDAWPFGMLVIDESSMFKAHYTLRFKELRKYVDRFERCVPLTGTPTPNTMLELWPQMYLMDNGRRLGTSYWRFRETYFEKADYMGFKYRLREGADAAINDAIGNVVLRLDAKDWLEMPELIVNPVVVDLPPEARAQYKHLEDEMFLNLERGDVEAMNAATLTGKCHQFANGALYTVDRDSGMNNGHQHIHDAKLDALKEVVEETGDNVLISYTFQHDLARLRVAYPDAPVLGGGTSGTKTEQYVREWNEGKHRVMLVHPASAGHGLNLQAGGHTLIFFSIPWSLEQYDQLVARLYRQGQKHGSVVVHHIITRHTVDEVIVDTLQRKARGQRQLLQALREYALRQHSH